MHTGRMIAAGFAFALLAGAGGAAPVAAAATRTVTGATTPVSAKPVTPAGPRGLSTTAVAASAPPAPTSSDPAAAPSGERDRIVQSILIEGAANVKPSDISARLKTRIGSLLTREAMREDLKAIWDLGVFEDVQVDVTDLEDGARVTYIVKERAVIREVRWNGARELGEKELKEKATLKEGDTYDPVKARQTGEIMLQQYREKGYPDASVRHELIPAEKERGKVDLVYTVDEGKKMHIEKVKFTGNKAYPEAALKKVLKNKESAFFFQSGLYLKDEVERDRERLLEHYKNDGFQKARILKAEVLPGAKPDKVILSFELEEGVAYKVKSITLDEHPLFSDKELTDRLELSPGDKLSSRKLDQSVAAMREMYTTRGYIYANIVPEFVWDDANGAADVRLRFYEGQRAIIDRIMIRGNEETKDKIILRELDQDLRPDQPFDSEKIRKSQENIYNLGFFEDVRVYTEPSFKSGRENLVFEVKERQTGTISLGGGYSSQFGIVGFLQVTKANLFGLGIRVSAEWEIGSKRRNLQLEYFDPYFLDSKLSMGLGFWDTDRELQNTFSQHSTGGSIEFGYRFPNKRWRVALGYKYELNDVDPSYDRNVDGAINSLDLPAGTVDAPQVTSSPNLTTTYDSRDNIFDPLRGQRHRWYVQVAGGPAPNAGMKFLGGDTQFYKVTYDGSGYLRSPVKIPLLPRPSLALNTKIGRGWGFGGKELPIFERFFLGGTDSVRGYGERVLGPKDPSGYPEGGYIMGQFNAELKWPIIPRVLTLAAPFYDMGNAWENVRSLDDILGRKVLGRKLTDGSIQEVHVGALASSVGLGIRLTVPGTIIVIRLDYGWSLTDLYELRDDGFIYENQRPKSGKLHFNIGNIF